MSSQPQQIVRPFDEADRTGILRTARIASASGQTQWVGWVVEADSIDALQCYAHCGSRDRFYWERVET